MSYTTVKAIWPGEKVEDLEELRNSHGSAPLIWNALCMRYLGLESYYYMSSDLDRLWAKWKDLSIPEAIRAVLMMTFDHAYIAKKDYQRAAGDIRTFLKEFPVPSNRVNHWPAIACILEKADAPAIGFQHTSVSEDPWQGPWNEEKEEHEPLDWSKAYSIYDDLYELKEASRVSK
jgi:hypothetical protein